MSKNLLTPERIAKMQKYVLEHPIDHSVDAALEFFDNDVDPEQVLVHMYHDILRDIGKLPPGVE